MIEKDADQSVNVAKENTLPQKMPVLRGSDFLFENYNLHHTQKRRTYFGYCMQAVSRNLSWILFVLIASLFAAICLSTLTPPIYKATAVLEVVVPLSKSQPVETESSNTGLSRDHVSVYYQILKNGNIAKAAVHKTDPNLLEKLVSNHDYYLFNQVTQYITQFASHVGILRPSAKSTQSVALKKLQSALQVRQIADSSLIEISAYASDTKAASDTANIAAFTALELIQQHEYASNVSVSAFYEKQLAEAKTQYDKADRDMRYFASTNNMMTPQQSLSRLQALQEAVKALQKKTVDAENAYKNYKRDNTLIKSAEIEALFNLKASLDAEYQQKLTEFKPRHPDMLELAEKIKVLDQKIFLQKSQFNVYIQRRLQQYRIALNVAMENLHKFQSEVANNQPLQLEYKNLTIKTDLARAASERLMHQYDHLKLTALNTNLILINRAVMPLTSFKTVLINYLLLALLIGLAGSLLIVLVSIYRGRIYLSEKDVEEELGIPVIASIPHSTGLKSSAQVLKALSSKSDQALLATYRKAANALYFSNEASVSRVLGITSANDNEGKTVTACALALEYASAGQRVLLVDAHLRNPALHHIFNIENQNGLTNILVSNEMPINVTHDTPFSNLYLICSGPSPANPMQLLNSEKLADFLEMAKQKFDLIILDCPPINFLDEMLLVGAAADNLVICLRTATTAKVAVKKAIKKILSIKRLPTGFVLTDQPVSIYSKFTFKNKVNVDNLLGNSHSPLLSK